MKVRLVSMLDWHLAMRAMEERCWGLAGACRKVRGTHTEARRDWVSIVTGVVGSIAV